MNILVFNGSPRKGNSVTAIEAFKEGALQAGHNVEVLDTYKLKVAPCVACGSCGLTRGCVAQDDSNMVVDKAVEADMIVWVTPVYWWGMTAQLKLVLDKMYCRGIHLKGKKTGVIVVGGSPVDNPQYALIKGQFDCIGRYLNWDILFHKSYYANDVDDLANDPAAIEELRAAGAAL